jgi:uncharacterized Zn-finger protein
VRSVGGDCTTELWKSNGSKIRLQRYRAGQGRLSTRERGRVLVLVMPMTSPVEHIVVRCPQCARLYTDWYRASINLDLDSFDEEYVEAASTCRCPYCGHKVRLDVLIVNDNVWEFPGGG